MEWFPGCRQPLPNRVTSELPVIREEFSKRVPLDFPVPDFWPGFGVPQSGAKRLNGIWGSQIRVYRIPIRASIQQASAGILDRKSTRLNSSHANISYAVFCLKKKNYPRYSLSSCTGDLA